MSEPKLPYSRRLAIAGALMLLIALVFLLGPLWWWALRGMSDKVGQAWICSNFIALPLLGIAGVASIAQPWVNSDD